MHLFSKLFSQCFTLLTLISELPGPTRGSSLTDDLFHPEEDSSSFFASSSDLASSMIPDATGWDPDHGRDGQSPQDSQTYTNIAALDLWDAAPDEENGLFEANPVLFANEGGACSSANGAEKRDGSGHEASCSSSSSRNNDFQNLHVPDLNGLLNTIDPSKSNEQQPDLTNEVLSTDGLLSKKNGKCSQRPYYLCCICDLSWFLDHCEDCSASMSSSFIIISFPPYLYLLLIRFSFRVAVISRELTQDQPSSQ